MRMKMTNILMALCFGCMLFLSRHCRASLMSNKRSDVEHCGRGYLKISPGNVGYLQLRTEMYNGTYTDADDGAVKYSTESYRPNEKCNILLYTNADYQLVMTSEYFALEDSENCTLDYLELKSDPQGPGTRFCGREPLTYITSRYKTYATFISNELNAAKGYKFLIKPQKVDETTFCNNTIFGDQHSNKVISNPAEGNNCFYRIEAEDDKLVQLTLQALNFGSRPCCDQSVVVYAGHSTHGTRLTQICSDTTLRQLKFRGKAYFIEYRNPLGIVQEGAFKIKYEFVEDDLPATTVQPKPSLVGGDSESLTLGGPYCGDSLDGRVFVTSGNSLRLELKTGESCSLRGFTAIISFEPANDCVCGGNSICVQQGYEKLCKPGKRCRNANCGNGGTCIEHAGDSHCYCKAGFKGDDCSVNLTNGTIQYLRFKEAPVDRSIQEGKSIISDCQLDVSGDIEVRYQWTLNGTPIEDYNHTSGFGAHPGGLLQIDNFRKELKGQYACIANTSLGVAEHTFQYKMVSKCEVHIHLGPGSVIKNVGQSALLPCYPQPRGKIKSIIWKKDGVPVDQPDDRFEMKSNNYLEIRDIKLSDNGSYSCHAEDVNGCIMSKSGSLTVLDYLPLNKYCGISIWDENIIQSRISKGTAARVNENPWHVNIRTNPKDQPATTFCGGTLISKKFVLTAAHCIDEFESLQMGPFGPNTVNLYFGTTDCLGGGIKRSVRNFSMHPNFNRTNSYDNDIALIELDTPIEYDVSIRPICLGEAGLIDELFMEKKIQNSLGIGRLGRVVGCGRHSQGGRQHTDLQEVYLPYVAREECEETLDDARTAVTLTNSMFCVGRKVARTGDTCARDGGGGFVMATDDRWILTGISSWGFGCDRANFYSMYTNVGEFYDWIKQETKFDEEQVENFLQG